ncbi:MAG: exodeoxyribonuclease VII large subunit [Candidatus Latescibacterota bacterium]|nr:exodeoxyribonuclease VII large subunit [Candidatus Latescibacterota bacterium]
MVDRPYTVSEVTQSVKKTLEVEFPTLWVVGELASYVEHASGHRYFTLKDNSCQLKCVMWRSQQIKGFKPEAGMEVVARGRLTVYERSGQYQLSVQRLVQSGLGRDQIALEELKKKLNKEGLFDESRKQPLPEYPRTVGVVTSRSGAAIRDVLNVLSRRFHGLRVVLAPATVQGAGADSEVAQAITDLDSYGDVDVIIVGRGGGAKEDLAAFNAEGVVRAIAASSIPTISAVGHEIDFTLADLVADVRAPTPSAAAELVVRDAGEVRTRVERHSRRLMDAMDGMLQENEELIRSYQERYGLRRVEDLVRQNDQTVDELERFLYHAIRCAYDDRRQDYRRLMAKLASLSPLSVMGRGYSIAHRLDDGDLILGANALEKGDGIRIRFASGQADCTVDRVVPDDKEGQFLLGI